MPFFQGSQGTAVKDSTQIDVNGSHNNIHIEASNKKEKREGKGIKLLVKSCLPEAIHDSGARGALGCHPGTREEYIRNITNWGQGEWNSEEKRVFLMTGPAGAGKSAIAQACAHKMEASGNLGASFFFYRPGGWNDPKKFIPTIVYQLATRYPAYRDCVDAIILDDPLILQKAMSIQFRELLVRPLQRPWPSSFSVTEDAVIVVDGLDECATVDAQIEIINLVTTSIHEQTTPFLWAFFSRPEPPITSAFGSDFAADLSWKLPLTLSGNADSDIESYIRASFGMIRAKHSIPRHIVWPEEENIRDLVTQSAGLFVYPATAMRYIGNGSFGLEQRLRFVLQLGSTSTENPFSALDQLYILIMMQIPAGVLSDTLSLLYLDQRPRRPVFASSSRGRDIHDCRLALGLSSMAFYAAISNLYSVLEVTQSWSGMSTELKFYHRSFIDFLFDETRSQQYFLKSSDVLRHCLNMIVQTLASTASAEPVDRDRIHFFTLHVFFTTIEDIDGKLEEDILRQILQLNWSYGSRPNRYEVNIMNFIRKIPKDWRRKIIRPSGNGLFGTLLQMLANISPENYEATAYIIGRGDKKALIVRRFSGYEICQMS